MNNRFYRKRTFLASISTGHASYILTEVESSRGGEYKWGHYMVTIADCRRRIQLEFFLGTMRNSFRKALLAEAQLITEYERAAKPTKPTRKTKKIDDAKM
jgi:hypothetical protein